MDLVNLEHVPMISQHQLVFRLHLFVRKVNHAWNIIVQNHVKLMAIVLINGNGVDKINVLISAHRWNAQWVPVDLVSVDTNGKLHFV